MDKTIKTKLVKKWLSELNKKYNTEYNFIDLDKYTDVPSLNFKKLKSEIYKEIAIKNFKTIDLNKCLTFYNGINFVKLDCTVDRMYHEKTNNYKENNSLKKAKNILTKLEYKLLVKNLI